MPAEGPGLIPPLKQKERRQKEKKRKEASPIISRLL
jgi:hypothetical protein